MKYNSARRWKRSVATDMVVINNFFQSRSFAPWHFRSRVMTWKVNSQIGVARVSSCNAYWRGRKYFLQSSAVYSVGYEYEHASPVFEREIIRASEKGRGRNRIKRIGPATSTRSIRIRFFIHSPISSRKMLSWSSVSIRKKDKRKREGGGERKRMDTIDLMDHT